MWPCGCGGFGLGSACGFSRKRGCPFNFASGQQILSSYGREHVILLAGDSLPNGKQSAQLIVSLERVCQDARHKPELPRTLTHEQVQSRKDKAVPFISRRLDDPGRVEEIEDESLKPRCERRKIELQNAFWRKREMSSKAELLERIIELEEENEQLQNRRRGRRHRCAA